MTKAVVVLVIIAALVGGCWFWNFSKQFEYERDTPATVKAEHAAAAQDLQKARIGDFVVFADGSAASVQGGNPDGLVNTRQEPVRFDQISLLYFVGDRVCLRSVRDLARTGAHLITPEDPEWDALSRNFLNVRG